MPIHVVAEGDTLSSIAAEYGVTVSRITADNAVPDANRLVIGQALAIRIPAETYTVQSGDTLYSIAVQNDTTTIRLLQNNPSLILNPTLTQGQQIVLSYTGKRLGIIRSGGYAYPYINDLTLRRALPYLTSLTIFGYGFRRDGSLDAPPDEPLISAAYAYSAVPIMLLSAMENNVFNTELASFLFENPSIQQTLIDNILEEMQLKGYRGIDIDFEFISPEDADGYIAFLENITSRLNSAGFTVNVDLAPKTSREQPGLLYEAHRYREIGEIANTVLLMTYEWGYTYSEPMAVAPIPSVRRVLDYAVTEIPPEKITMGIPSYGYDWTLPYVKGSAAVVVGNDEAVSIAAKYNVPIQYDETAETPFFRYFDDFGKEHEVWFEDARSISAKLRLVDEYGFLGVGYWNLMRPFLQNWTVLADTFDIAKLV